MRNDCLITFLKMQKQPPEVFYKRAILKNFAIFTGKHTCWSLLLMQNIANFFQSTYFEEHLQAAASENVFMELRKTRNCS